MKLIEIMDVELAEERANILRVGVIIPAKEKDRCIYAHLAIHKPKFESSLRSQ